MNRSEAGKLGAETGKLRWQEVCRERRSLYEASPIRCNECQTPLPFEKKGGKFCGKSCAALYNNRVGGLKKEFSDLKTDPSRKHHLILERGQRCEDCKLETWKDQKINLELHHVDGNSDNSDKTNLMLLCPNCHSYTENSKGKNRFGGLFTARRRRRMKQYERAYLVTIGENL